IMASHVEEFAMKVGVLALSIGLVFAACFSAHAKQAASEPDAADTMAIGEATDSLDPEDAARITAWQDYQRRVADALFDSDSPRDWVLAADSEWMLGDTPHPLRPKREVILQRASDRAPDDAIVQWLVANDRLNSSTCKATPSPDDNIQALVRIEPGNAAAWMLALGIAVERKNQEAIDDALARMASSSTYNDHFADVLIAWMDVYKRVPMPEMSSEIELGYVQTPGGDALATFVSAMGQTAAMAQAGYGNLLKTCRPSPDSDDWRRYAYCEDAGRLLLAKGTTVLARGVGFAILRNLGDNVPTPADRRARLNLDWRNEHAMTAFEADTANPANVTALIADWRNTRNETEVLTRSLRRAGLASDAPEGWLPSTAKPSQAGPNSAD
ncbi:MAG: hypothetical protein ACREPX_03645, partial [Rhodanobacteraceae bacterium]